MIGRLLSVCFFVFYAGSLSAEDLAPIPPLSGRVVDTAGVLSQDAKGQVEATLASFEHSKGSQIAVLIVNTTAPEAIEQYSMRVAESWKIGRKNVDDGVILLIAMQDRTFRLEVGYALEGAIPDITAKRILEDVLKPFLRSGDVGGGVQATVDAVIQSISGESLPAPRSRRKSEDTSSIFPLFLFGGMFLSAFLSTILGRPAAAGITASLIVILGFFLAQLLLSLLAASLVILLTGLSNSGGGYRAGRGGGWNSGSFGGSSGGFSGGGFSGGGGSFGGGGASGRW